VPKLTILGPDAPERQVNLADRDLRIGRDEQNDIVLPDSSKSVSRYHAELRFENGQYVLLDLNSQNGLWVGGRRVPRIPLEPGVPVLVGSYRLVLDPAPADASTVVTAVVAGSPATIPSLAPEASPNPVPPLPAAPLPAPPKPAPPKPAPSKAAPPARAASGSGVVNGGRSKKAALFGGVAVIIVLAAIVVGLRGRSRGTIETTPGTVKAPVDSSPGPAATSSSPASEDLIRTSLAHAKSLLEGHDPDGALAELDRVTQVDPLNKEVPDLKARANELKNPPPEPAPPAPAQQGVKPSPAKPADVPPSGPPPVLARKSGESADEWHARDRAIAARYDRAKVEVDSDSFQAAIRDLNALQHDEPNYLNVPSLLQRAQGRARATAQAAIEQGANLEKQGQLPEALQQYRRAVQADPSVSGADDSIQKLLARMKADGTDAYNSALTYYTLARYPQAIPLFEKAVRLLPDGDPDRKSAQDKLAEAKSKQ
jgi:pSer/pThr/pTyr-binding forkhead associated (FHA) protein